MRSYNNLYEPMLQDDYIKQCFINASKKKKNRNDVREVLENLDEHTELLKKMLTEELFIPDYHKPSIINESSSKKTRRILKPHYKYEQVIAERRMSNMTDWKKVTGTQPERPEEIDRTSSPSTVYLRKNIEQVEKEVEGADGKMQTVTEWQYDEKEMTVEEYENMALMKSVVEENTSGIVESVTQFQKDAVIDEYTAQLIEEGLI